MTDGNREAVLAALRIGCTRTAAAGAAGISAPTFYRWMQSPDFSHAVMIAESEAELAKVRTIAKASEENWTAAAWWLERRRAEDYARKDTVTVLAKMAKELDALSDADLLRIANGDGEEGEAEAGEGDPGEAGR